VTARKFIVIALLCAAGARAEDFYAERMQRGLANYQRGNYAQAALDFRVASFGMIESPVEYETALIYGVLANQKLGHAEDATQMAEKILNVERVAPVYAKLPLPVATRAEIDAALPKVLRPEQLARVPSLANLAGRSAAPMPTPPTAPPVPQPQPQPPSSPMQLLQKGDEAGARAMAEKVVADDYTNALAHTVLAILSGRRGDWAGVVEHYSIVRTRRRLTDDETNTFVMGLVRTGRTADAAGVEKLRGAQPFVAKAMASTAAPTAPPDRKSVV